MPTAFLERGVVVADLDRPTCPVLGCRCPSPVADPVPVTRRGEDVGRTTGIHTRRRGRRSAPAMRGTRTTARSRPGAGDTASRPSSAPSWPRSGRWRRAATTRTQISSSTASGAYAFLDSSWGGYGGYRRARDAPPSGAGRQGRRAGDVHPSSQRRRCLDRPGVVVHRPRPGRRRVGHGAERRRQHPDPPSVPVAVDGDVRTHRRTVPNACATPAAAWSPVERPRLMPHRRRRRRCIG